MGTVSAQKRILTIDDEQAIVDLIVDLLESNNYIALSATKWTDAVDALNHENIDLILLDLKMPTIHGTSILDFIINEELDIPVIVVSGFVTEQVSDELRRQGVKGIVRKPFKSRALLDEIEKHIKDSDPIPEPAAKAIDSLYNRPAAPPAESKQAIPTASMDALYGTPAAGASQAAKPATNPENDILRALKRNAAQAASASKAPAEAQPADMLAILKKQAAAWSPQPVQPPKEETLPTPPAAPQAESSGPPPMSHPMENPLAPLPLTGAQSGPDFGVKEHHSRSRRPRKRMDRGNMMFMGAITVICLLVAGFLAVMQWVASEAPIAMEQLKSDLESGVNSQMQQQMKQMQQQMQTQTIQQKLKKGK
jgi:CheY-like chemotaxis protein